MATDHLLSIFIALATISVVRAAGITIDLMHRDSPRSPFYSNATSHADKLRAAIERSNLRAREIARRATIANLSSSYAGVHRAGGEYLVELDIGTPPKPILLIVDTGSDLTWVQCKPCVSCFDQGLPIFDPKESASYGIIECGSSDCSMIPLDSRRCSAKYRCAYNISYVDKSYTVGNLATETLTFDVREPIAAELRKFIFGCSHKSRGIFAPTATGVLGLGQAAISLPWETRLNSYFRGKFAYCLVPWEVESVNSKLSFGDNAVVSGYESVSIPMVEDPDGSFAYLVTLKGISLGDVLIKSTPRNCGPGSDEDGNLLIDTGAYLTYLPEGMFDELVLNLKLHVRAPTITDPIGKLRLCFQGAVEIPTIAFHFDGMDLGLPASNTFMTVARDVSCLEMLPSPLPGMGILGNRGQENFLVGFDIVAQTITFQPRDCKTYQLPSSD